MALSVAVLATGGTIAPRTDASGTAAARAGGREPLDDLPVPAGVALDAEDGARIRSHATALPAARRPRPRRRHRAGRLHRVPGPDGPAT